MLITIAQTSAPLDQLMNLGVAGIMGAMWLWERRTSRQREEQIDEAHARIMSDRVALDQLMDLVRQNVAAMTRFAAVHEQSIREMRMSSDSPTRGMTNDQIPMSNK